ncbi:MAG: WGR domain-containing protein [Beijerinckiaceae bacterium]|nr:WGR domain-containing protein [Beijerinckiaceae bacterium]
MSAVTLTRIETDKNMRRFYRLDVQPTLFGEFALVREWGRIGRGGQVRSTPYPSAMDALTALETIKVSKLKRKYAVVL